MCVATSRRSTHRASVHTVRPGALAARGAGTVSLLTNFERAADLDDWEIGVHGVWIDFVDLQNQTRSAVYLPDVIPEQGGRHAQLTQPRRRTSL